MDLLGYAALGGLERVAIVIGAVVIGYWGYRLYAGGKNAGLVFMGLSVVVLVGALATGSSHLKSLGEGYQLASTPPPGAETLSVGRAPTQAPEPEEPLAAPEPSPFRAASPPSAAATPGSAPDHHQAAQAPEAESLADAASAEAMFGDPDPIEVVAEVAAPVRIATGQELGGRIVSVKSENVTLEWSNDSD